MLLLHKKLYSRQALDAAIDAFGSLAEISLVKGDKVHFQVNFDNISDEFGDALVDEFANYVLGLTAERRGE